MARPLKPSTLPATAATTGATRSLKTTVNKTGFHREESSFRPYQLKSEKEQEDADGSIGEETG
jgi:hypothetical protein